MELNPVTSTSGVSDIAAYPPSPIADDPSALPSPTSLPPVGDASCPFTWCQPLYASCCATLLYFSSTFSLYLLYFLLLYYKIKNVLLFMYYLCEKYYKPIKVQYFIVNWVSWVPRLTVLDLEQIGLTNALLEQKSCMYAGDLV